MKQELPSVWMDLKLENQKQKIANEQVQAQAGALKAKQSLEQAQQKEAETLRSSQWENIKQTLPYLEQP